MYVDHYQYTHECFRRHPTFVVRFYENNIESFAAVRPINTASFWLKVDNKFRKENVKFSCILST